MKKILAGLLFVPVIAHASFYTGNDLFSKMNGDSYDKFVAAGYVMGVYDSLNKILFCAPANVTLGQVTDMVKQYLEVNPSRRHFSADSLMSDALRQVWPCPKKGSGA